MIKLDEQEKKIVKALIKDPRSSDNQVGKETKVPIRSVSRKRKILEELGIISYFIAVNRGLDGTGRFGARHLHIIKFKMGIPKSQIVREIMEEKNVKTVYGEHVYESHIAEVDGHVALIMIIEGRTDDDIVENFNKTIVPALQKNHGIDSIVNVQTIRLSDPVRIFHNYVPMVNMKEGRMKKDWPNSAIFID